MQRWCDWVFGAEATGAVRRAGRGRARGEAGRGSGSVAAALLLLGAALLLLASCTHPELRQTNITNGPTAAPLSDVSAGYFDLTEFRLWGIRTRMADFVEDPFATLTISPGAPVGSLGCEKAEVCLDFAFKGEPEARRWTGRVASGWWAR